MKKLILSNKFVGEIFVIIARFIFNVLQFFIKTEKKTILFSSFSGRKFNDSPRVIYEALLKDPYFKEYNFIWAFRSLKDEIPSDKQVRTGSVNYLMALIKAKYWISNSSIERLVVLNNKEHVYINTWHGIPLKLLGADQPREDYLTRFWYQNVHFDLLLSSGPYDQKIFRHIFPSTTNIKITGLPRNDILYKKALKKESIKVAMQEKLKLDKQKKTILYAPTFRTNGLTDRSLMKLKIDKETIEKLTDQFNFLIRPHYFIEKIYPNGNFKDVRNEDLNELMICSDMLITDYSSIMFDYFILEKPVISFAYDLEDYEENNGTYIKLKDVGIPIVKKSNDLLCMIDSEFNHDSDFKKRNEKYNLSENNSITYVKQFIKKN